MSNSSANPIIHHVEDNVLTLEREFDAPRELVFECFSKAEHLKRWWSTNGWETPVCNVDFRPGGVWLYCMKCVDENHEYFGYESWGRADYKEIVPPERIVFVDSWSDQDGNIVENEKMKSSHHTYTFLEQSGKTKLVVRSVYPSVDALKAVVEMGMLQGITETWGKLDALLSEIQS